MLFAANFDITAITYVMTDCNHELIQLMQELSLSTEQVAICLGVSLTTVSEWINTEAGTKPRPMPESELRLLKYALMTENKHTTLF